MARFPDRLLILRDGDRMRSLKLSSWQQLLLVSGALLTVVWNLAATIDDVYGRGQLAAKTVEVTRTRHAYHELVDEVASQNGRVQAITRDLEVYRSYLLAVVEQNEGMQRDVQALGSGLGDSAAAAQPTMARQTLRGQLEQVERDISRLSVRNDLLQDDVELMRSRLEASAGERARFAEARALFDQRFAKIEQEAAAARAHAGELEVALAARQELLARAQAERGAAEAERDRIAGDLRGSEQRIAALIAAHQQSLDQISERTRSTIEEVERIVGATGLSLKQMLPVKAGKPPARGGPFVPLNSVHLTQDPQSRAATDALFSDFDRLEDLRNVLRSVPLGVPLAGFEMSGQFGPRIDPFNGERAFHTGIDLQSALRSPVVATAGGRVIFAGWHATYGRLVEIDHGLGLQTRYAHLDQILVKEGQEVVMGGKIGLLGQSGRASGPHLHYEVVVNGRPSNPVTFLRASHVPEKH